ncbi:hypothetical protein C1645_80127 [Glomus cerebriforme]|uniref:Protein kinase domain-containing protein n=1 Tax=Glomus cerebriforme TaxID=658196 RepID=A0A397T5Q3_9GLOM|nr:hypothetical protein C1645_80127 [Glomus cerebriforme]
MELTNTNENYFNPTSKLKSSPIPINFLPFNKNARYCFYCKNRYTWTQSLYQKCCENCFSQYVNNVDNNNTYLDVLIETRQSILCQEHEKSKNEMFITTCNIKEWCRNCLFIIYFKQIFADHYYFSNFRDYNPMKNCTLCGKLIYQTILTKGDIVFKLCSDCYLISSGWINSLNEKPILILYLPWWDNSDQCLVCNKYLDFISDCQKWCTRCYIIYSGCRYCLTTNIIFGLSDQSQCRKCNRILVISIADIMNITTSGNKDIDALLYDTRFKIKNDHKIINEISSIDITIPSNVYTFLRSNYTPSDYYSIMQWISYSQIKNLEKLAEGGFGIIYKAICPEKNKTIAVKRLKSSQKISRVFK